MKKTLSILFVLVLLLSQGLSTMAYAQGEAPGGNSGDEPLGINTFTVSPDPAPAGEDVTISINADINTADATTYFCLYAPKAGSTNWTFPATITLSYTSGFPPTKVDVDFNTDASNCSPDADEVAQAYKATTAFVGTKTYDGSTTITIPSDATPGSAYSWKLYLGEPASTPNPLSYPNYEILAAVTDVYVSDQANCGGYGVAGYSCFQSLQTAIDAVTTGNDVIIVGDLTSDASGSTTSGKPVSTIRGISTPRLVARGACAADTLLTIATTTPDVAVTVRDITVDGTTCSGAAIGIDVSGTQSNVLDNLTVQNFSSGTGIKVSSSGVATLQNSTSSISDNNIGFDDASSGIVKVGTGPSDGNTFSGNTIGIQSNGGATIVGNTITGGTTGINLTTANPTNVYGNSVTGAGGNQIACDGSVTEGAGWNYLGSAAPTAGTNCADKYKQLGAPIAGWDDDGTYGGADDNGGNSLVFQLSSSPYGIDSPGTTVFAMKTGNGVTVPGTSTQYKMFMDGTDSATLGSGNDVCFGTMQNTCWEADAGATPRAQNGPGYFSKASTDPTAITLSNLTVTSARNTWVPVALFLASLSLVGGLFLAKRRRAQ